MIYIVTRIILIYTSIKSQNAHKIAIYAPRMAKQK